MEEIYQAGKDRKVGHMTVKQAGKDHPIYKQGMMAMGINRPAQNTATSNLTTEELKHLEKYGRLKTPSEKFDEMLAKMSEERSGLTSETKSSKPKVSPLALELEILSEALLFIKEDLEDGKLTEEKVKEHVTYHYQEFLKK